MENGDLNWILPGKLLAFSGPSPSPRVVYGYRAHVPEDYWAYFKAKGVTAVVRLNRALYDGKRFADGGFSMHELYFPDGSCPPEPLLSRFLHIAETEPGALAIHCKAGLGRTGVLICSYLIKHFGFTAEEAIGYIRVVRPGSVIGLQQNYLLAHAARLQEEGLAFRAAKAKAEKEVTAAVSAPAPPRARKSVDLFAVAGPAVEAPRAPVASAAAAAAASVEDASSPQTQPQTRASRLASLLRGVAAAAGSSLRSPASSSSLASASSSSSLPATPALSPAGSTRNLLDATTKASPSSASPASSSSPSPSPAAAVTRTLAPNGQPRKVPSSLLSSPEALAAYAADEEGTAEGEHAAPLGATAWATPEGKRIGASRR